MSGDSLATKIVDQAVDSTFNFWAGWPGVERVQHYVGPTDGELLAGALIIVVVFGLLVLGTVYTIKLIRG